MTHRHTCDRSEALAAYLYDDCPAAERREIEAHLESCEMCRDELAGLRDVRRHLDGWRPPEQTIGFHVVSGHAPVALRSAGRPALWRWGLAAAAVLVLAAAAAVANLQVRYSAEGLMVTTGWTRASLEEQTPAAAAPAGSLDAETWARELAALEHRLRQELASVEASVQAERSGPVMDDAEMLRRVRGLIQESERRQQREVALRLTEMVQEFDRQRQLDLVRVQRGLGRLEQLAGAEMAQQRGLMNYLVRSSQQRQQR